MWSQSWAGGDGGSVGACGLASLVYTAGSGPEREHVSKKTVETRLIELYASQETLW